MEIKKHILFSDVPRDGNQMKAYKRFCQLLTVIVPVETEETNTAYMLMFMSHQVINEKANSETKEG